MSHAADLGEDGEGVRIPLEQDLVLLDGHALFEQDPGAVHHRVAFSLAAPLVDDDEDAVAVHGHQLALVVPDGGDVEVLHKAVLLGVLRGLLADPRGRAADVERPHRKLGSRLADGLGGDHAHRLTPLDRLAGGEVAAVTQHAHPAP